MRQHAGKMHLDHQTCHTHMGAQGKPVLVDDKNVEVVLLRARMFKPDLALLEALQHDTQLPVLSDKPLRACA